MGRSRPPYLEWTGRRWTYPTLEIYEDLVQDYIAPNGFWRRVAEWFAGTVEGVGGPH